MLLLQLRRRLLCRAQSAFQLSNLRCGGLVCAAECFLVLRDRLIQLRLDVCERPRMSRGRSDQLGVRSGERLVRFFQCLLISSASAATRPIADLEFSVSLARLLRRALELLGGVTSLGQCFVQLRGKVLPVSCTDYTALSTNLALFGPLLAVRLAFTRELRHLLLSILQRRLQSKPHRNMTAGRFASPGVLASRPSVPLRPAS